MLKFSQIKYTILTLLLFVTANIVIAQEAKPAVQMADQFYKDGKIYIVVLVVVSILVGLFIYLISLDKKIKKLEQEIDK